MTAVTHLARPDTDDLPWRRKDLARLLWLSSLGLLGLILCWYGTSGENNLRDQVPWLLGAIAALLVAGVGASGWLLTGLRAVHTEAKGVGAFVRRDRAATTDEVGTAPAVQFVADVPLGHVIGAAMTKAHRADCPHVQGKVVAPISEAEIARLGRRYCGVCCR